MAQNLGTTSRTSREQYLEPRDDSSSVTLSGSTLTWNLPSTRPAKITLAGDYTMSSPERMIDGMEYTLAVLQDSTGSRKLSWGSAFVWPDGVNPDLSFGPGDFTLFKFYSDGNSMFGRVAFQSQQVQ